MTDDGKCGRTSTQNEKPRTRTSVSRNLGLGSAASAVCLAIEPGFANAGRDRSRSTLTTNLLPVPGLWDDSQTDALVKRPARFLPIDRYVEEHYTVARPPTSVANFNPKRMKVRCRLHRRKH
jgi:hypothetical protein